MIRRYHLTATALRDFDEALEYTARHFGIQKTVLYRDELLDGMQRIADEHERLFTHHRKELARDTDFHLHLVAGRYIAYRVVDDDNVIIAAIFRDTMDVPSYLRMLKKLSDDEIALLKNQVVMLKPQ